MASVTATITTATPLQTAQYHVLKCGFNRPADAGNAYVDKDILSDSAGTAASLFFAVFGNSGVIESANITLGVNVTTGFDLLIFDAAPTDHADSAQLALVAGDMTKLVANLQFADGDKLLLGASGFTHYRTSVGVSTTRYAGPIPFHTTTGFLHALLVVRGTPTIATGTPVLVRLGIKRDL